MPSMFSTHTNEVEIIIGLLVTCWNMVPLRELRLHFPQPLWVLNLSVVSRATDWALLCFCSGLPAVARLLQTSSFLEFSQAAVVGLLYSPPPCVFTGGPEWLSTQPASAMLLCSFCLLLVPSPPRRGTHRLVGCQEVAQIQMTCNSNGKASSKREFYFSSLCAHMSTGKAFLWMSIVKAPSFSSTQQQDPKAH